MTPRANRLRSRAASTSGPWRSGSTSGVGSSRRRSSTWRPTPTSVRLVLRDTEAALVAAASLGQREQQCCGFFEVAIELGPDRRTLTLRVPDGAEEAMATFVSRLTP